MNVASRGAVALAVVASAFFSSGASAVAVSSGGSGVTGVLTDLGLFAAGTYTLTGSGTVDLVGGTAFTMNPDGVPTSVVTSGGYGYFNPAGSLTADGNFGAAGSNAKIGALIGTLSATPSTPSDWFLIGYSKVITLASAGHVYASVNDTFHNNNSGAFDVSVTAVPEPASTAMVVAGLGIAGLVIGHRRRRF